MKQVFFTTPQVDIIRRAIVSAHVYLAGQFQAIQEGEESSLLESIYCENCPKDELDKAVLKAELEGNIIATLHTLRMLLSKFCELNQNFYNLSIEDLEELHDSIHIYHAEKLETFLDALNMFPDEDNLIFCWLPELSNASMARLFQGFVENQKDMSFFENEINEGHELHYYLRNLFPNTLPKSESEKIDRYLDILLGSREFEQPE